MSVVSEIARIKSAKSDLKTAINSKLGSNTPIQDETIDDYASFVDNIPSGGNVVNGIIEQYKAESGTIDANTFVEFVNKYTIDTIGEDTELSSTSNSGQSISAVALSDSKVFIAHTRQSSNGYLYGIVCTIDGTTITAGNDTSLETTNAGTGKVISVVKLDENKVFIAHSFGTSNVWLYGLVCEISGTTITKGSDTQLSTDDNSGKTISAVALSENKVFIAHQYGSSYRLYGIICTIDNNTITKGSDTAISTGGYGAGDVISAVALNENKVFIAHSYNNSYYYLYGIICTINNTTITTGTDTQLSSNRALGYYISAVALSDTKVFIAHGSDSSNSPYLNAIVCTINDTTITAGSDTQLSTIAYTGNVILAVALNKNKVFIAHSYTSYYHLNKIICSIDGTTITKGSDNELNSTQNSGRYISITLSNGKVFIAHSNTTNYNLYSMVTIPTKDTIQPSTSAIQGLTKDECSPTTAGDVFVLDESWVPSYNLVFDVTPSNATIVVTDSDGNEVTPISAGNYKVPNGTTYNYEITANGYFPIRSQVTTSGDTTITNTMQAITGNELFNRVLQAHGGASTIEAKGTPDFSQIATTDEGMYMAEDDLGKSYYFRGTAPDNYVSFAGKTWRIVRINGDNSVRLISADTPITSQKYNSSYSDNMYVGYKYTSGQVHGLGTNSNAKSQLETWYTNNLESYDSYIADQVFVNDRRPFTDAQGTTSGGGTGTTATYYAPRIRNYVNKTPSLTTNIAEDRFSVGSSVGGIPTNASCTKKIGMLTADEACMAGGIFGTSNSSYYLYTGAYWWLGSPYFMDGRGAYVFSVNSNGNFDNNSVDSAYGLRPVISLLPNVQVSGGTGTSADPYVIDTTQS